MKKVIFGLLLSFSLIAGCRSEVINLTCRGIHTHTLSTIFLSPEHVKKPQDELIKNESSITFLVTIDTTQNTVKIDGHTPGVYDNLRISDGYYSVKKKYNNGHTVWIDFERLTGKFARNISSDDPGVVRFGDILVVSRSDTKSIGSCDLGFIKQKF
jgi:hypothetical protein